MGQRGGEQLNSNTVYKVPKWIHYSFYITLLTLSKKSLHLNQSDFVILQHSYRYRPLS